MVPPHPSPLPPGERGMGLSFESLRANGRVAAWEGEGVRGVDSRCCGSDGWEAWVSWVPASAGMTKEVPE